MESSVKVINMECRIWKRIVEFNFFTVLLLFASFNSGLGFDSTINDFNSTTNFNRTIEFDTSNIDQFIVGGDKASPGEFPSQAALCMVKESHIELRCASSIISRSHCLTAGHCVHGLDHTPEIFKMIVGITSVKHYDPEKDVYPVIEIFLHPEYENKLPPFCDVAVIKVKGDFASHGSLAPAPLPRGPPETGQMCTATGWGLVNHEKKVISPDLMKVDLAIRDPYECARIYHPQVEVDTVGCVCAGYERKKSICNGDSGGPLICRRGEVHGIASWGHAKCGEGAYPSVFTKVYEHLDFIKACMKQ
ncbi:hypothetical protein LSTR_LSTR003195 [Laodelphax striatellus]|uniref:Peptidase S1 domain-containing protein n=1 Tax=Laodelphax striatellus TaxID=195883 RepID=A0A482XRN9_LAOST|nr:hypothetical protein LSTR_LSTR003195 [Laodelphax striatellus]